MQYQNLSGQQQSRKWLPWALGIVTILCLVATVLAIVFAINNNNSSVHTSECDSAECIHLADSVLQSIDESVDPCDDFYQYACGNWIDDYDWDLVSTPSYSQFSWLTKYELEQFLDALYYNVNESIVGHDSVRKTQTFYDACYHSNVNEESLEESQLLNEFIESTTFIKENITINDPWDNEMSGGFIKAVSWLTSRSWNFLFETDTWMTHVPVIYQNYEMWLNYNSTLFRQAINDTYVPLYQSYFGLNEQEAEEMGREVSNFADNMKEITTANIFYYYVQYLYSLNMIGVESVGNWTAMFGQSEILNLTEILFQTFDTTEMLAVIYYTPGLEFFSNLTVLLNNTSPQVVQYWIYTSVLINGLNFESSLEQSRLINRVEFCFYQVIEQFPFVYGYILENVLYGKEKYDAIYDLVETVLVDGIVKKLNSASWMDESSLKNSIKKTDYLGIYVGLPPRIGNYTALDKYYSLVTQSNATFIDNLGELLTFQVYVTRATFGGVVYDMITPWPSIFDDTSSYGSWLTGINAFYVPTGNFFTIPITISQIPFFDQNYPSAVNFGGLGSVIGHEISHGFDPTGSLYNYNGSYQDIWTSNTRSSYEEVTDCFVNQYNGFEVGDGEYVNGTQTITENVADNGGNSAAYEAWQSYIKKEGKDETLPGVDMTSTQLFYWSWAHVWCQAYRPNYYNDWTDVHSPNPARVWGVVQNSKEFADAFNCPKESTMNPDTKCVLW